MQDKQTTAFILIIIVAFIFWAYNKKTTTGNLLADLANSITGKGGQPTSSIAPGTNNTSGEGGTNTGGTGSGDSPDDVPTWKKWFNYFTGIPSSYKVQPGQASIYTVNYNAVGMGNGQFPVSTLNAIPMNASNGTTQPYPIGYDSHTGDV